MFWHKASFLAKEMSQMVDTKFSIYKRFTSITVDERDYTKSEMQAVMNFLNDDEINNNEEEYYSSIDVTAFFALKKTHQ